MASPDRLTRSPFLLASLLLLLANAACDGDDPAPIPDGGTEDVDGGTGDSGTDAPDSGTPPPDAGPGGTDGGLPPHCSAGWTATGPQVPADTSFVDDPTADILERLRAIPGLTVQENPNGARVPTGYRFFIMEYNQPTDHSYPLCQRFTQRLTLLHRSDADPMVLYTGGYYVSLSPTRRELTSLLGANQLSVEHRYFPPSRPEPTDWSLLTIQQSAADFHRIVQALKPIYKGRWLSTGGSKGGETVVFFRRFYPDDVDATVAYVAPIARRDDERFPAFQHAVGGDAQAACRERIHTFQRTVLERRGEMLDLARSYAADNDLSFTQLGIEKALEHSVIETCFAFWQYDSPVNCDQFPGSEATNEDLLATINAQVGLSTFADTGPNSIGQYAAYYYQAAVELGWPRPYEAHLGSLIHFPGTDTAVEYAPPGVALPFSEQAMQDIQDWVSAHGERLMFIYGDLDPWTAASYSLGGARDSFLYMVPGGNHGASIGRLPEPQKTQATETVLRWATPAGLKRLQRGTLRAEPQFEPFGPRLPPRLRQPVSR